MLSNCFKFTKSKSLLLGLLFIIIATSFSLGFCFFSSNEIKNVYATTNNYTVEDFLEFENAIKDLCENDNYNLSNTNNNQISSFSLSALNNTNENNALIDNKSSNNFSKFYLRRLIVIGNIEETFGATKIINGYKDYSILCYDTEEQTKYAYEQLLQNNNIKVIIDSVISTNDYADNIYDYSKALTWSNEAMNVGGINEYLQTNGTNENVVVVILDTGINISHPLFNDRFILDNEQIVGYSYTDTTLSNSQYDFEDDNGHGSHVAGIVTNLTPDNVKILPIKVMDSSGYGSFSLLLTALARVEQVYSSTYNISCVNLSLGGYSDSTTLSSMDTLFQELRNDNILTIVAAGNDQLDTSNYMPANSDNVITVSSLKKDENLSVYEFDYSYSNFGTSIDISAPGTEIVSAYYTNHYAYMSGTSMAAPHISAAVALLCLDSQYWNNEIPTYSADVIESRLYKNVVDLGDKGWDKFYGYGMIDLKYFNIDNQKDVLTFKNNKNETLNIESYIEFTDNFNLNVVASDASYEIYYTTNGTIPNNKTSNIYSSSIEITNSTIFNFMAYKIVNGNITESSCLYTIDLFNPNDNIDDFFVNEEGTLIKYTGHFTNLEIPNIIDGIEVLSLGARLFSDNEIVNITLPDSCIQIGVYCFSNCENLESIEYNQVNTIDAFAFENCSSLSQINLQKVQNLGAKLENFDINGHTFENCTSLTSVYLPKLTTIGENTFKNSSVNKVVIGYSFNTCYGEAVDNEITIYGYAGSGAEQYANLYGNEFIVINALSIQSDLISSKEVQQNTKDRLAIYTTGYEQTYQWYKTNDTIANGELLVNETLNYLQLDTSTLGTTNYFVKVTDWDGSYIYSHICSVTVIEKSNINVAQIYSESNGWTYYTTLESAISNSVDDDVIVITQDCYITDYIIINKYLTLVAINNATLYIDEDLIADSRANKQPIFNIYSSLTLGFEQNTYQDLTLSTLFIDGQSDLGSFYTLFEISSTSLTIYSNVQIQNCKLDKFVWGLRNTSLNIYGATICDNFADWISAGNHCLIGGYFNIFIGNDTKFINNTSSNGAIFYIDCGKLDIEGNAIFTKNKFEDIIRAYSDATINITGGIFTENTCDNLIMFSVADDTSQNRYENKLYINGGISSKNIPLSSSKVKVYDIYITDTIASLGGSLSQLKSCIEIGQNCKFNNIYYNNRNATNFNITITENLTNNQYFHIDISNPTAYTNVNSDTPILIYDSGLTLSLHKFQSQNYNFISGKQVDGKTYVYIEEKPTYEFKYFITQYYSITQIYNSGDIISKIDDPELEGFTFMGWYKEYNCQNLYSFNTMPSNNVTVYAKWEPLEFSITASAGQNGTISPIGTTSIIYGESKTFTFTPNAGYKVADIQIDGISLTEIDFTNAVNNGYTFSNVLSNHRIHVEFRVGTYTIIASAGQNGTITPSGTISKNYNESQTFVITANDGYLVERIVIDGNFLIGSDLTNAIKNGYTFANINADHTINVQFEENNYVAYVFDSTNGYLSYYTTLESAVSNAPTGSSVVILKNCDVSQTIVVSKEISIGIDNKVSNITINKKTDDYLFRITNSGVLDIMGAIIITGNNNKTYATNSIFYNEGILNIRDEDFTIKNTNCINAIIVNKNEMLMKGGIIQNNTGNAILNNGTLSMKYNVQILNNSGYGIYSDGTLKITDGTITNNIIIDNSTIEIGGNVLANNIELNNSSNISVSSNLTNAEQSFVLDLDDYTYYQLDSSNPLIVFAEGLTIDISKFSLLDRFYELQQGTQSTTSNNLYVTEIESFTITYNLNYIDSTAITQKYLENDCIVLPESPTRTGYQFKGWYNEQECSTAFNLTTMPANDLTVYAKWEINKYTITANAGENGTISPNGEIQVEYNTNQTFTFNPNTGYEVSKILIDGVALSNTELELARNNGYTFLAVNDTHTIHIEFDLKLYSITYSLEHYGLENITQTYYMGDTITIPSVIPFYDYHYYFNGWYTDNTLVSLYQFSIMPAENFVVYGGFALRNYNISATYNEYGTVSPTQTTITFPNSATFNLSPNAGYVVLDIKVDGNSISSDELTSVRSNNKFTFTISKYGYQLNDNSHSESHIIDVQFSPIPYKITYNQNYTGAENIITEFPTGATIVLIDNPTRTGYQFKGWYNEQECLTAFNLTTMPANDLTVYAKWEINKYTITASAGENGTISPSGTIYKNYNESQLYTFTASVGYHVSSIEIDGIALTGNDLSNAIANGYSFNNISENHTIYVDFAINTYTIIAESNNYGSITPNGTNTYNYGENQTFVIISNEGYHVRLIEIDGIALTGNDLSNAIANGYTFSNITDNHNIYVEFEINTYTISTISIGYGQITPSGNIQVEYGTNKTFTFTPNVGYYVSNIEVDGTALTGNELTNAVANGYTFSNLKDDHIICVEFKINTYNITANCGPNGTITPSGTISKNYNESQIFVITANEGYEVGQIFIDNLPLSKEELESAKNNGYEFKNITNNHSIYVEFSILSFSLTYDMNYDCGDIVQVYEFQENIVLTDNPTRTGYQFKGWYNEQECLTAFNLTTMPANDITIYAKWEINKYTITANAGENGTISPNGEINVEYGSNKTFTFTPNAGYHVNLIEIDGIALTGNDLSNAIANGYTFSNITDNHTICSQFEINKYNITLSIEGEGKCYTEQTLTNIIYGEDRLFIIETDFDKYRVEIYINNSLVSTNNKELKIEDIDENMTIEVKFVKKSFFETEAGIITIISSCVGIFLISISIPIIKRIKRKRMYKRMSGF